MAKSNLISLPIKTFFVGVSCMTALIANPAFAQQAITPGAYQVTPGVKCNDGFKKQKKQGNQHDPNYTGASIVHLCTPKNAKKNLEKSRTNPMSAFSIPFLSLDNFGNLGGGAWASQNPIRVPLEASELIQLNAMIDDFDFPAYIFSGCHDRAHAAYLMLPENIREKTIKIWVVSPSKYSRGVKGAIKLPGNPDVSWGYHVALAFQTSKGLVIYDGALSPEKLVSESEWLNMAEYPPLTFKTYTFGSAYLFSTEDLDTQKTYNLIDEETGEKTSKDWYVNKLIWTGEYYGYDGKPKDNDWIPYALARDAVGVRVESSSSCESLQKHKTQAGSLLNALKNRTYDLVSCSEDKQIFEENLKNWRAIINR